MGIPISQSNTKVSEFLKTNFNFEVKQIVHFSITNFTSLENKTEGLKPQKYPDYEKNNLTAMLDSNLVKD